MPARPSSIGTLLVGSSPISGSFCVCVMDHEPKQTHPPFCAFSQVFFLSNRGKWMNLRALYEAVSAERTLLPCS